MVALPARVNLIFSQFGYIHAASREATLAIQELGILNVFKPKCIACNRMDDRQSCRESCAAYKRNPQNHIAAHNCKQGNCAVVLASACKQCIRNCDNIKSVSLSAAGKANPDVGDTSFENCYHTFGCASDCKAALKKVKMFLSSTDFVQKTQFVHKTKKRISLKKTEFVQKTKKTDFVQKNEFRTKNGFRTKNKKTGFRTKKQISYKKQKNGFRTKNKKTDFVQKTKERISYKNEFRTNNEIRFCTKSVNLDVFKPRNLTFFR